MSMQRDGSAVWWRVGALALAGGLMLGACGGGGDKETVKSVTTPVTGSVRPALATAPSTPSETGTAEETEALPQFPPSPEDVRLVRLVIPAAKVNAPLQVKGVNARNEMENPDGKDNVAWYDFTSRPGGGSNAVFSGHVDWFTGERGVFWFLRDLKEGDEIVVKLSGDFDVKYAVVQNVVYKADEAPVAELVGDTKMDYVTLITCDGVFNRSSQDYENRRVIRAVRTA